jgi:predicted phage tail protein
MLRKIKLYGKLAKFIGHRVLEADVATAAEAVRFLLANWPEAEAHMSDQYYRVSIGTYDIDLEELHHPAGAAPISFVPVVAGAGAVGRILIGVALVGFSICQFWQQHCFCRYCRKRRSRGFWFKSVVFVRSRASFNGISQLLTPTPSISKTKATHARASALAGFKMSHAQVFQSPWFTVKRWSAAL